MTNKRFPGLRLYKKHLGAFDFTVWLAVGKNLNSLCRSVRRKHEYDKLPDDIESFCLSGYLGKHILRPGYDSILWIPAKPTAPKGYATLAHECLHAVHDVMDWAGIELTQESNEAYAHTLGCLVTSFLEQMRKK